MPRVAYGPQGKPFITVARENMVLSFLIIVCCYRYLV